MARRVDSLRQDLVDLVEGRPGWRLEARSTPGASPLWCYVSGGEVEFSATAEKGAIRLYVMATDQELVFRNGDELADWLRVHREEALQERRARAGGKSRFRELFEWG